MKLTTTASTSTEVTIDIQEEYSIQNGMPCIDFVVSGHLVARQIIEQQPVGQAFRIINKLYIPSIPQEYTTADNVDISGLSPDVTAPRPFIGTVVPTAPKKNTKPA